MGVTKRTESVVKGTGNRVKGTEGDLCVTRVVDADSDPDWGTQLVLVTTPEQVRQSGIPAGWRLLRGEEARRFLNESAREEIQWAREQRRRRNGGGLN
jgi:hypothetical protein